MRRLFLTLMFSFMTASAWALPNLEGTAVQAQNPGTGTTVALQCGTNPNRLVHVAVSVNGIVRSMTGITYNAVSLAETTGKVTQVGTTAQQFYLNGAASGSNTLSMTMSASGAWAIVASCWSGVNPTTPIGTAVTAVAAANSITSPSITVPAGGMVIDSLSKDEGPAAACSVGSNQTEVVVGGQQDGGNNDRSQSSYKTISGSTTIAWTCPNTYNLALMAVPVNGIARGGAPFVFK